MTLYDYSALLDKLSHDKKPAWGKMTPQHMVEHLTLTLQSSNGKITISECITPPEKLNASKRFLMSSRPLPRNFINTVIGAELKPLSNPDLESAKKELSTELADFENFYRTNPQKKPIHATFGPLNKEEWIQFHKKHFRHHLEQFELLEA
jgi:oxepin-CoA hydrolase/3-oxo-5,6-dehydrosuberyl-CoA semialdehyde dehydrogenase